jgi:hypothetical protein
VILPDPLTQASIDLHPLIRMDTTLVEWGCGCWHGAAGFYFCQYHEGFEDGVEAAQRAAGVAP